LDLRIYVYLAHFRCFFWIIMITFNCKYRHMKTKLLLTLSLFALSGMPAVAQNAPATQGGVPAVTVGTIETNVTSREKVLSYPRLLPQALGCDVLSFDFSITAGGTTWGPVGVKGAVFSTEVKDKIKETEPENVKISITNIRLKCSGQEMTANPINLEYNH